MCCLPPLIHLQAGYHPPVSATYQSHHFLATFQSQSRSTQGQRAPQMNQKQDIPSVLPAVCTGQVGAVSQRVQGDTVCHRETVWIGDDTCQEGLSALQSEVTWERRDRIRMARGGRKNTKTCWHERIHQQVHNKLYKNYNCMFIKNLFTSFSRCALTCVLFTL